MKTPILLFFLILNIPSFAQLKTSKVEKGNIPASIHYKGHLVSAIKYTDQNGTFLVITTETGEIKSKGSDNEDNRDADLFAYCYQLGTAAPKLNWQVHDYVKECPVDLTASFVPNTFAITDLDNNGKAETWLMYKTVCHGDVSPLTMKIIMYEGNKKYAVRGLNKVKVSEKDYEGGNYSFDEAFKNGPALFRKYAEQLWKKNLIQKWE